MSTFYEAFEREKNSDIKHHGVKGMRWGQRNPKVYVPVGERQTPQGGNYATARNENNPTRQISMPGMEVDIERQDDVEGAVQNVQESTKERVKSMVKEVAKQVAIRAATAVILGGLVGGGILIRKKLHGRTTFGSTPEGEALRQKVEGAAT